MERERRLSALSQGAGDARPRNAKARLRRVRRPEHGHQRWSTSSATVARPSRDPGLTRRLEGAKKSMGRGVAAPQRLVRTALPVRRRSQGPWPADQGDLFLVDGNVDGDDRRPRYLPPHALSIPPPDGHTAYGDGGSKWLKPRPLYVVCAVSGKAHPAGGQMRYWSAAAAGALKRCTAAEGTTRRSAAQVTPSRRVDRGAGSALWPPRLAQEPTV